MKLIKKSSARVQRGAVATLCVLILAGSLSSCSNKSENDIDMSEIDFSNIENLYEQPLPVIQKCVEGKWEVKWRYGGVAGAIPVSDVFVEINNNKLNGIEFQWEKCTFQSVTVKSYQTYAPVLKGCEEPSVYFTNIKNDSLSVQLPLPIFGELWVRSK